MYPTEHLNLNPQIPQVPKQIGNRQSWHATECGVFHLSSAKNIGIHSVLVWKTGGYLSFYDGNGRLITSYPTLFTGSFYLKAGADGGLYARIGADTGIAPAVTVTWIEDDD